MQPMIVETVRVVSPVSAENPLGYVVINAADFDASRHDLFSEESAPKRRGRPPKASEG